MARVHSLDGLMKWLRRDEWRDAFAEVLNHHLLPACSKANLAVEKLPSIIGEDWFMTLWGCAFEDFLSRDLDDGRNFVDDYLKRRGWKEGASSKAKHNIVSDIEVIPIQKINEAYERMLRSDVKYRFVIDMASLRG